MVVSEALWSLPSEAKHKFIYITGGGEKPDIR